MSFNVDQMETGPEVKRRLNAIRYGQMPDNHGLDDDKSDPGI